MNLPSGPRQWADTEEDDRAANGNLGGAFKQYGRGSRDDHDDTIPDRPPREPSRADTGDWHSKVPAPGQGGGNDGYRSGGYGNGFRNSEGGGEREERGPSRADEADRWTRKVGTCPATGATFFSFIKKCEYSF